MFKSFFAVFFLFNSIRARTLILIMSSERSLLLRCFHDIIYIVFLIIFYLYIYCTHAQSVWIQCISRYHRHRVYIVAIATALLLICCICCMLMPSFHFQHDELMDAWKYNDPTAFLLCLSYQHRNTVIRREKQSVRLVDICLGRLYIYFPCRTPSLRIAVVFFIELW